MPSFDEIVTGRRSVRAFDPARRVPLATLREALELARHSPSNCNAQPWQLFIVTGERCTALRSQLLQAAAGLPEEESATPAFTGVHRERQIACAVEMYGRLGVERHDREGRRRAALRNFEFFDAPQLAILCMPAQFDVGVALDVGIYLQTLMLALHSRGVASCAQAALRCYASVVRRALDIPDGLRILAGLSFGYALPDAPVNAVHPPRIPLAEHVQFIGYEGADEAASAD